MRIQITQIKEILEPARRRLIWSSLFVALLINILPWHGWALNLRPDFVAIVLLYWCIREPLKISFGAAWVAGLFMDVAEGSLLGQHAMAYVVLIYLALLLSRRLQMFDVRFQALHILPILVLSHLVILFLRLISGAYFPGWTFFLPCVTGAAIWPVVCMSLGIPWRPRRSFDRK